MRALSASFCKFAAHNHYQNLICHNGNFATLSARTTVKMLENLITNISGGETLQFQPDNRASNYIIQNTQTSPSLTIIFYVVCTKTFFGDVTARKLNYKLS